MNTSRIIRAAREIERLQLALQWLNEFGPKVPKGDASDVTIRPSFAASCNGANEAHGILSQMVANRLPDLILDAVLDCENTIEIHQQTICDEAVQ